MMAVLPLAVNVKEMGRLRSIFEMNKHLRKIAFIITRCVNLITSNFKDTGWYSHAML